MPIIGECITGESRSLVSITDLTGTGCTLNTSGTVLSQGGEFHLWIGAIGPFAAVATVHDKTCLSARFKEPLDNRIPEHFQFQ